jgi:hypothetical protein
MYEVAIEVYKLMVPIQEKARDYKRLAQIYDAMKSLCEDVVKSNQKRVLGTYFRITQFGSKLGQQDGQAFIFKEKMVTQLSEIVQRLSDMYRKRFGDKFKLINDITKLDPAQMDPECVYLSVVYCEPYLAKDEASKRQTYFERVNDISRFVFEQPYTLTPGKAHGEVDQQYKKKTILTSEKSFPYIKKRQLIVSKQEIDLTPIEVSIEAIVDRCEKLRNAIDLMPNNLKNLQLLLQGSVRPQVNRGPLEIAQTFLDKSNASKYKPDHIRQLQDAFRNFVEYVTTSST